jgi:hypothetical protein
MRPLSADSIAPAEVTSVASTNDIGLTAWGFGVEGLSFTTLLRARARGGSDLLWPRTDDQFDALLGYAQLVRGHVTARAGRQEIRSGLGFSAFDGGMVTVRTQSLNLEAYGGRSLARGLREPTNEALQGLESFVPDQSVRIIGGAAHLRVVRASFTGRYQREMLADGAGLASERASLDFNVIGQGLRVSGSMDWDYGNEELGKGHLTVSLPLFDGHWLVEATARRYVPYFQMSTIWGFFEPVSYSETTLRLGWSPTSTFGVWASGGRREYQETNSAVVIARMRDDGWRANVGARLALFDMWSFDGSYRLEIGPGSSLTSGDASVRFTPNDRISVAVSGTSFQQVDEFRVGEGRAVGGGLSFDLGITERITLAGGGSVIRHRNGDVFSSSPWDQSRGWSAVRIAVGNDPGLSARARRTR